VTKDNTTIVEGGVRGRREGRIAQIKREIDDTDSDWDREKLQDGWPSWPAAWPWSRSRGTRWS